MVYEHFAVEVVVFVLEDAGFESLHPVFMFFEILVEVVDEYLGRSLHALVDTWYGEASFVVRACLFAYFYDFGIDECLEVTLVLWLFF